MGDEAMVKRAEKEFLKSIEPSSDEENQPPKKKRRVGKGKEKVAAKVGQKKKSEAGQKKGQKSLMASYPSFHQENQTFISQIATYIFLLPES